MTPLRVRQVLCALVFASGLALTAWGLQAHGLQQALVLPQGWARLAAWAALLVLVLEGVRHRLAISRLAAGAIVITGLALLAGVLWPLLVVFALAATCWVLGAGVLRTLGWREDTSEPVVVAIGMACLGTFIFVTAHHPVAYPALYGAGIVIALLAGRRGLAAAAARLLRPTPGAPVLEVAIFLFVAYLFLVALLPETGHDALAVHLFVPSQLASRHQWGFDAGTYAFAVMPMLADWLYGAGHVLAGETAARLVNLGATLLAAWLVTDLARRAGAQARASRWAPLLLLSTPLTFAESTSLFIESTWLALLMAATVLLLDAARRVQERSEAGPLLSAAGLLLGGALATKAVTFMVLPGIVVFLVGCQRGRLVTRQLSAVLVAIGLAILVGSLPYLDAWRLTGNPVFPFFNNVFQSPLWYPAAFQAPDAFDKGFTWRTLYAMTFESGRFLEGKPGAAGFQWLLVVVPCVVAAIALRRVAALWLFGLAAASLVLTFQSTAYLRYVFPAFAWCCAGVAAVASSIDGRAVRALATAALLAAVGLNVMFYDSGTLMRTLDIQALLGGRERQEYLRQQVPVRALVPALNALNSRDAPVAVLGSPAVAGLRADALHASWYNIRFEAAMRAAATPQALGAALAAWRVEYILLDDMWSTPERRRAVVSVSDVIEQIPGAQLLRLKPDLRFAHELLRNTRFESMEGWGTAGSPPVRAGDGIEVTVKQPVYQRVAVEPGRAYRIHLRVRCGDAGAVGRYQVNWLDAQERFLATSISLFDCSPTMESLSRVVQAPPGARAALVYGTGHTEQRLVLQQLSFAD